MECTILTTETECAGLVPEWEDLQARAGWGIFTGPEWFGGWWRHIGREAGLRPHIVAGRREGRLVAVAPLTVAQRKGVRLLQWAAGEVCDYSDFLLEDEADAAPLWDYVRKSPHFDLALIKEVHPQALCLPSLAAFATPARSSEARAIRIEWPAFDGWLATLPYAARKQYRSRIKQMQAQGALSYEVMRDAVPEDAFAAFIAQKTAWYDKRGRKGIFATPGGALFFRHIMEAEGRAGRLHFSLLRCGADIMATHLGFVVDGSLYCYMHAYDERFSALSPGRIMLFKSIGWAIENGCREFDFLRGEEDYKNSLAGEVRVLRDFVFARTLRGKLARLLYLRRARKA